MRKRLIAGLVLASLISIHVVVLMAVVGDVRVNTLQYEFAKILLQVGLVSAAAAAASLLGYEFQREGARIDKDRDEKNRKDEKTADEQKLADEKDRDRQRDAREYRRSLLEDALDRATASYFQVKRARRLMRALAKTTDPDSGAVVVMAGKYDQEIVVIIDAQLEFEGLAEHVRTNPQIFSSADDLARRFDDIEDYLSGLISEYEDLRAAFTGEPPRHELTTMTHLDKFLASARREPEKFAQGFRVPQDGFQRVQKLIRQDLLENLEGQSE